MILADTAIARDPGGYVLGHVVAMLKIAFSSNDWRGQLAGGINVTDDTGEALRWVEKNTKWPFCVLEVASLEQDRTANETGRWLVEISIESVTLSASSPVERALKAAVIAILSEGRGQFNQLGIEETSARAGQGSGANPERINPATLFAAIHAAATP